VCMYSAYLLHPTGSGLLKRSLHSLISMYLMCIYLLPPHQKKKKLTLLV